jgi:hypothetical protein
MQSPNNNPTRIVPTEAEISLWHLQLLADPTSFELLDDERLGLRPITDFANFSVWEIAGNWHRLIGSDRATFPMIFIEALNEADPDTILLPTTSFRMWEAGNPINPLQMPSTKRIPVGKAIELMQEWISVSRIGLPRSNEELIEGATIELYRELDWMAMWDVVQMLLWESMGGTVADYFYNSLGDSKKDSVINAVVASVYNFMIGYSTVLFPCLPGLRKFHAAGHLWRGGYVATCDGETWRLYSGQDTEVVWECRTER